MDLSKKKRYDELVEEFGYVKDKLKKQTFDKREITHSDDYRIVAAIIVASQHSSYSYESKTKIPGQKMKEYRLSHGLSQEQLAKQLGISRPYMSEIESNKRSMSVKTIKNFTDKLGITLSDFFK